jgi:hypothetical protein
MRHNLECNLISQGLKRVLAGQKKALSYKSNDMMDSLIKFGFDF